jgi:hypothetical protein
MKNFPPGHRSLQTDFFQIFSFQFITLADITEV